MAVLVLVLVVLPVALLVASGVTAVFLVRARRPWLAAGAVVDALIGAGWLVLWVLGDMSDAPEDEITHWHWAVAVVVVTVLAVALDLATRSYGSRVGGPHAGAG